jgi:hypothetical protein
MTQHFLPSARDAYDAAVEEAIAACKGGLRGHSRPTLGLCIIFYIFKAAANRGAGGVIGISPRGGAGAPKSIRVTRRTGRINH